MLLIVKILLSKLFNALITNYNPGFRHRNVNDKIPYLMND